MTAQDGSIIGLVVGGLAWLFSVGYIVYNPDPKGTKNLVYSIASSVSFSAIILFMIGIKRKKTLLGTTGDFFIYGFATAYDLLGYISPS